MTEPVASDFFSQQNPAETDLLLLCSALFFITDIQESQSLGRDPFHRTHARLHCMIRARTKSALMISAEKGSRMLPRPEIDLETAAISEHEQAWQCTEPKAAQTAASPSSCGQYRFALPATAGNIGASWRSRTRNPGNPCN